MIEMRYTAATPQELERLAAGLSTFAAPELALLLSGPLGAGKSVFARGFIRGLTSGNAAFDIPSPTFTLVQTYDETRIPVAHVDLYRLSTEADLEELALEELLRAHVLLVEWPERLGGRQMESALYVEISGSGNEREVLLAGNGAWVPILSRNDQINQFLRNTIWNGTERHFLEGDASFRRYETLTSATAPSAVLMDMQARPDGPPVRNGKPYSAIAHLAEDIRAVIAVNAQLCRMGFSAPTSFAVDLDRGLAVIEDLGSKVYGRMRLAGDSMHEPMRAAVEVLADMAARTWPARIPVDETTTHLVPDYDQEAQLIEADLLPSWFWPYLHDLQVPPDISADFALAWSEVLPAARAEKPVWVLRDFHSPNLLWLPERTGIRRVGLIDTQDCLVGHPAYDLASLLQDARVDISAEEEADLFEHYCAIRAPFDRKAFAAAYAILGAQRTTKILGIFARLSKRDGKHGYLQHLPRVSRYLERNLRHKALAPVRKWYDRHLPRGMRERGT